MRAVATFACGHGYGIAVSHHHRRLVLPNSGTDRSCLSLYDLDVLCEGVRVHVRVCTSRLLSAHAHRVPAARPPTLPPPPPPCHRAEMSQLCSDSLSAPAGLSHRALLRTIGGPGSGPLQFNISSGLHGGPHGPSGWPCFLVTPPYSLLVPDPGNNRVQEVRVHVDVVP